MGVSELQREQVIRTLRESYARGELTDEEFDEKLSALFSSQTEDGLRPLLNGPRPAFPVPTPHGNARLADVEAVERHLSPGERIHWVGKPDPAKHFTKADGFLIPFSILWCGFAFFWEATAISGGGGFFDVWGTPFVAIGLYFVFGRFIYKANLKRRTTYAVTDKRVMAVVRGRDSESVEATYLRSIPNIATTDVSKDCGSVELGLTAPIAARYGNTGMDFFARGQMASSGVRFYDIEDPQGVADLVERLREADRSA